MELTVKRTQLTDNYTTGHLYINGEYFCDTLEDKVRKLTSIEGKVYGRTAIPSGTYESWIVLYTFSAARESKSPCMSNTILKNFSLCNNFSL